MSTSIKNHGPSRNSRTKQGYYIPLNPSKYKGDLNKIIYRSSWEKLYMRYCDLSSNIVEWSSESLAIPYISPIDMKPHKYFIDFQVVEQYDNGEVRKFIVEVKPKKDYLKKPIFEGRRTLKKEKQFKRNAETWLINNAKFEAAINYAKMFNMEFKIINEETLGIQRKN